MLALLASVLVGGSGTAHAGGGRLAPVQEQYDPGEVATLVGYTGGPALGDVPAESFYAYLRPAGQGGGARLLRTDVYVGELAVVETPHRGYLHFRVHIEFEVPPYLAPGEYDLVYCDDPCTGALLGDLVPSPLSIGVAPARPVVREWALDDPEIVNLAPDALLVGPGFHSTAADLRAPEQAPPTAAAPAAPAPAPAALPVPAAADEMDWPLPTALVVGAALGTGLVLSRRQRRRQFPVTRRWAATDGRTPGAAPAVRG